MLRQVEITPDVMSACWAHALTTEKEEIMGLLVGKMEGDTLVLSAMKVIRRLTKQKDRVEFDNKDLIEGSEFAESLPSSVRVLGWYHSHPHITVHPSHVDLATQAGYQLMDENFVGLIFSVFNYDPNTGIDSKEVAAFQSVVGEEHLQEYSPQCGGRVGQDCVGGHGQHPGHTEGGGGGGAPKGCGGQQGGDGPGLQPGLSRGPPGQAEQSGDWAHAGQHQGEGGGPGGQGGVPQEEEERTIAEVGGFELTKGRHNLVNFIVPVFRDILYRY
eukprot:GFUD01027816.1.p1 GENE.GFUD01027816.1~~GFUD01027816.1.p1  ORF type:complete len:272 (+),score=74.67 GFUD01027816.1:48-863(+)